ncbi:MAG: type II toxin-antitoxin system VapC family toxin [Rhodospirillaceae bacterium]|nr:type II toxin-antitoxin system VapC family toxin [Rhodospirillaceae bacterium]
MIVVDTSALMAMVLNEPPAAACRAVIGAEISIVISGATMAEALVVATGRNVLEEMTRLLDHLEAQVEPVGETTARRVARVHARWGRGMHPAGLNFGDCFAYDAAMQRNCPLLYVGKDFAKTDVKSALK